MDELIICAFGGCVGVLAFMCAILGTKLSELKKENSALKTKVLDLQRSSDYYWNEYMTEMFENIALKSRVGRLQRELFRAWDNYAKKNDEE